MLTLFESVLAIINDSHCDSVGHKLQMSELLETHVFLLKKKYLITCYSALRLPTKI